MRTIWCTALCAVLMLCLGCGREPGSTNLTKGALAVQADEAVMPSMTTEVGQFQQQYTDAKLTLTGVDAREAVADFAADSVQVIAIARKLNKEETDAIATTKIQFQEYRVAIAAVAVIVHPDNSLTQVRMSQLDSIFSGAVTRWPGKGGVIDLVIGGQNSSTNEVFRDVVLKGKPFAPSATPMRSSKELIDYVAGHAAAVGIVGSNWLTGQEQRVTAVALGIPGWRPDSTEAPGQFYSPAQAYVYKGYYPIVTTVYMYTREQTPGVGLGFISFVTSPPGQKIFLNAGLVPVTQPVRLVKLSSQQVQ